MSRGGRAWRGWFPVGGELTSGRADRKEGLYVGEEHAPMLRQQVQWLSHLTDAVRTGKAVVAMDER